MNANRNSLIAIPLMAMLASLLLNTAYVAAAGWGSELLSVFPFSDSYWHLHRAWHSVVVASDGGAASQFVPDAPYLWLLIGCYTVFGVSNAIPFLLNVALISLATFFSSKTMADTLGRTAGLMAGGLCVLYGPYVFFAGITVKTSLAVCLMSAGTCFATRYFARRAMPALFLSVLSFSVLALDRNNAIVLIMLLSGFVAYYGIVNKLFSHLVSGFITIAIAVSISLLMAPWKSAEQEQKFFSPIGLNFYVGNAPGATGGYTPLEEGRNNIIGHFIDGPDIAERATGRELSRWEVSQYWFERSFNYYRERPLEFVQLQLRKTAMLFAQYAPGLPEEYRVWRWQRPVLALAVVDFGLLAALALVGMVILNRRLLEPQWLFPLVGAALYAGTFILYEISERYRVPLAPLMIPFASMALVNMLKPQGSKQIRNIVIGVFCLYAASIGLNQLNQAGAGWSDSSRNTVAADAKARLEIAEEYRLKNQLAVQPTAHDWLSLAMRFDGQDIYYDGYRYAENAILLDSKSKAAYGFLVKTAERHQDAEYLEQLGRRISQLSR